MEANEEITHSPVNTQSILSLVFGILTLLFLCGGMLPVPFTGFICFPLSVLLGLLALMFGIISLNNIRKHNHSGRPMAWMGITIGGFVFICMLCMMILAAAFFIFAPNSFQVPHFFDKYHI